MPIFREVNYDQASLPRQAFRSIRLSSTNSITNSTVNDAELLENLMCSELGCTQEEHKVHVDKVCDKITTVDRNNDEFIKSGQCVPRPPSAPRRPQSVSFRMRRAIEKRVFEPKEDIDEPHEDDERPSRVRMRFLLAKREAARLHHVD